MLSTRLIAPAIALAALLAGSLVAHAWQRAPLPVSNARVTTMALAPWQPQRVYIGLRGQGVWRSDDRGATWTDRSAGLPMDAVVLGLLVGPTDPDLVFAGTEERAGVPGTVYRSTNGGASWTASGTGIDGASVRDFESLLAAPSVVYAGVTGGSQPGVYKSTDNGVTWSHLSGAIPAEGAYVLAVNPGDLNVIVAGTETGWARTTDGGTTWTTTDTGYGYRFLDWNPVNPNIVYGTQVDPSVFADPRRSTDQGDTFQTLMSLPYVSQAQPIAAHPSEAATVFVGGSETWVGPGATSTNVWKTTDGGSTYTEIFSAPYGRTMTGLLVDPFNPSHLYMGEETPGETGFRHTSDGGGTWAIKIDGLFNHDIGTLCETVTGRLYAMWDARTLVSIGNPETWADLGYYGPGYDHWGRVDGMVAGPVGDVLFRWGYWSEGDIFGTYLWKSPDGGSTWWSEGDLAPADLDFLAPIHEVAVDPGGGQRVYVSQEFTGLFRNDHGGGTATENRTYTLVNPALTDVELAVHPVNPLVVYAAGGPLTMEKSIDGGVSTVARNAGLPAEGGGLEIVELFLEVADPDHLEVVYSDGRVYETENGGLSWQLLFAIDLQGSEIQDATWDPMSGDVFLATTGAGVLAGIADFAWQLPTNDVKSVHYSTATNVLWVGTQNAGLWWANLLSMLDAPVVSAAGPATLRARPNPFGTATTLELDVPAGGAETSLVVYDAGGRLVRELSRGWQTEGSTRVTWDGRDGSGASLPSGVYFVRASVAGEVSSRKVVLRR